MFKRFAICAGLAVCTIVAAMNSAALGSDPTISGCRVKLEEDVNLGAKEPGVLVELNVKDGSVVRKGEVVGKIDDSEAQIQRQAAEWALRAAIKQAKNDVPQRYAEVSAEVAEQGYKMVTDANKAAAKSVSQAEVDQAYLKWREAKLLAEKSKLEQELAVFDAHTKQAELDAAKLAIDRRVIRAEFDGQVIDVLRQQGEWVGPGDPILRLVRLDKMLVEGPVFIADYDPHELQNCEVTVEVELARGRKEQLNGRIRFVSPLVRLNKTYLVQAEVTNREEHGQWLLRDGMPASMTIHLNTGGATPMGVGLAPR